MPGTLPADLDCEGLGVFKTRNLQPRSFYIVANAAITVSLEHYHNEPFLLALRDYISLLPGFPFVCYATATERPGIPISSVPVDPQQHGDANLDLYEHRGTRCQRQQVSDTSFPRCIVTNTVHRIELYGLTVCTLSCEWYTQ